jgi:hypothetical protein
MTLKTPITWLLERPLKIAGIGMGLVQVSRSILAGLQLETSSIWVALENHAAHFQLFGNLREESGSNLWVEYQSKASKKHPSVEEIAPIEYEDFQIAQLHRQQ